MNYVLTGSAAMVIAGWFAWLMTPTERPKPIPVRVRSRRRPR